MVTPGELRTDVNSILQNGEVVRFKYYAASGADASYDDDVVLTQSGSNIFTSGLIQPLKNPNGDKEAKLVQQGRLKTDDFRLYINGTVPTSGILKVSIGSPSYPDSYSLIPNGVENWGLGGEPVYKKLFLRYLTTGSLKGE